MPRNRDKGNQSAQNFEGTVEGCHYIDIFGPNAFGIHMNRIVFRVNPDKEAREYSIHGFNLPPLQDGQWVSGWFCHTTEYPFGEGLNYVYELTAYESIRRDKRFFSFKGSLHRPEKKKHSPEEAVKEISDGLMKLVDSLKADDA